MDRRIITLGLVVFIVAFAVIYFVCRSGSNKTNTEPVQESVISSQPQSQEEMIEVVVDDETGEILGIKANEVGDYYIINPQNEVMIDKNGHSTKFIPSL